MKSIKPGRGSSAMSFIGSIVSIIFGVFWTIMAAGITADSPFGIGKIFPLFGVLFIVIGIFQAIYNYKNATGKKRYSMFDITDSTEEGDPSYKWIKNETESKEENECRKFTGTEINYCPYCGTEIEGNYMYCPKCGKKIK